MTKLLVNAELRKVPVCSCGWVPLHCRICGRELRKAKAKKGERK